MRISLLIKTIQKAMVFQQKLSEKTYFIVKITGPTMGWPTSSDKKPP